VTCFNNIWTTTCPQEIWVILGHLAAQNFYEKVTSSCLVLELSPGHERSVPLFSPISYPHWKSSMLRMEKNCLALIFIPPQTIFFLGGGGGIGYILSICLLLNIICPENIYDTNDQIERKFSGYLLFLMKLCTWHQGTYWHLIWVLIWCPMWLLVPLGQV
jgi:hypothetical protein